VSTGRHPTNLSSIDGRPTALTPSARSIDCLARLDRRLSAKPLRSFPHGFLTDFSSRLTHCPERRIRRKLRNPPRQILIQGVAPLLLDLTFLGSSFIAVSAIKSWFFHGMHSLRGLRRGHVTPVARPFSLRGRQFPQFVD
jgi:hypothetical protein